jgi:hypothetical protein
VGESVKFETRGGSPVVLEVHTPDGKLWEMKIVVSVVEVIREDAPLPPPADPSIPNLNVQLQVTSRISEKT